VAGNLRRGRSNFGIEAGLLGKLKVNNMGRIQDKKGRRSFGSKIETETKNSTDCYMRVRVGVLNMRVHVLCALAFVSPRPSPKHTVDHINRRKSNNRSNTIRWCTLLEQGQNLDKNRSVHQIDMETGEIIRTYDTISNAARAHSILPSEIISAAIGKYAYSGGYRWEYAN
jgi:hypothetical protein